ncbi:conjugal transfer protein TrbI [Dyella flava]|nr:conjugal transfer protein TrbI [Dyella flava]
MRRVNNMPLMIVCGVIVVFIVLIVMVAAERASKVKRTAGTEIGRLDKAMADQVLGAAAGRTGGIVDADIKEPSLPIAVVDDPDQPPFPPGKGDPEMDALRASRMAMLQKAISASMQVSTAIPKNNTKSQASAVQAGGANDPARIPQNGTQDDHASDASRNGVEFSDGNEDKADRWRLDHTVEAPRTPFELRAGFVIPAVLMSGINSELPGQIIGQVSQDVYDTPTGKYKLIPQGTRLVGTYNSQVVYGQSRVLVAWQRLVFPDGKALDIGSMPGADGAGYAGFGDKVNNHYLRIFGSALLLSGIVAGVNSSQTNPANDPFGTSTNTLLTQAIAQQMGTVATEMVRKNINIAPTLEIRPGYRFNVMVVKDLTFAKPYQPFDY